MIARYWSATTTKPAEEYRRHFQQTVVSNLEALDGFGGCYLLESQVDGATRFVAITLWESTEHIAAFAGTDITRAHVEPEGQAALTEFDAEAINYAVSVISLATAE